jgi:hypothetical protein
MPLMSVTEDFVVKNGLVIQGTTAVTTSTGDIGSLQSAGGIATQKNLIVGTTATIWGNANLLGQLSVINATTLTGTLFVNNSTILNHGVDVYTTATMHHQFVALGISTLSGTLYVTSATTLHSTLNVNNTATLSSDLIVSGNSTLTGTLGVVGNVSLNSQLSVNGASTLTGTLYVGNTTKLNNSLDVYGVTTLHNNNNGDIGTGALVLSAGGMSVFGNTYLNSSTIANIDGTGSLSVAGGVYVGNNLIVAGTNTDFSTNLGNAVYIEGGVWIDKTLKVLGQTSFGDNVTFNGGATFVYSTNTYYTDNMIELHVPPGGVEGTWSGDDLKDIGFRFHYYLNSDQNAALILANDTHYLEWYNTGIENSSGTFIGSSYGTFKTGSVILTNTTESINTTSGALVVAGGVGIGGGMYVRGVITGTVTTSTNIAGGQKGYIPIQSAPGVTAFIPSGTADAQVLTWVSSGTVSTATWTNPAQTTVGNASYAITATNISGGAKYDIPYQSDDNSTIFNVGGNFQYNYDSSYLKLTNIQIWGDGAGNGPGSSGNQIIDTIGRGIELYSTGSVQLNWNNNSFVTVNSSGIHFTTNHINTVTLDNIGKLTLPGILKTDQSVGAPLIDGSTDQITMYDTGNHWNYAQGIEDQYMWFQVGNGSAGGFKWYSSGNELLKLSTNGTLTIDSQSTATAGGAGSLVVDGGIYLAKNIRGGAGIAATQGNQSADLSLIGGAYLGGNTWINSTQTALISGTAALSIVGGEYIGDNLIVNGNEASTSTTTGALIVAGGVGIGGNVNIAGQLSVEGGGGDINGVHNLTAVTIVANTGTFQDINSTGTVISRQLDTQILNVSGSAVIHGIYITQYGATLTNLVVTGTTVVAVLTATSIQVLSTLSNYTPGNAASTSNYSIATLGGIKAANDIISGGIIAAGDFSDTGIPTPPGDDSGTIDGFYLLNNMQSARSLKNISGTSPATIDTWSKTLYTSAKYVVQVVDSGSIHTEEMLLIQDGTNVYISQYGLVYNNAILGVFDGSIIDSDVVITFTPAGATDMKIQVVRQSILTTTEIYG